MKGYLKELEKFLTQYGDTRSLSLMREDLRVFSSRVFEVFSLLTFPSPENMFLEGIKAKALHSLWRVILNDMVDTHTGRDSIVDSLQVVAKYKSGINYEGKTVPGQIMHDVIQRFYNFPSGPNRKIAEELLFLDLLTVLNGFDYKRIVQRNDTVVTLSEYMEFGAVAADLRIFLDVDTAVYPYNMNLSTIGDLREACKWFELAFRFSSDIATFEREFFVEESCNAVVLYGQEKGVLPKDVFKSDNVYRKKVAEQVVPSLMNTIEAKGKECLDKSVECLEKVNEVDTSGIQKAFTLLFENYPERVILSPAEEVIG
jgi:hypothetical protein